MNTEFPPDPTYLDIVTSPDFFVVLCVMAFILGACIGSFLNVCIMRLPLGMSTDKPKRSFCFRCGARIAWYDNLPILSYLILGGRDRHCGSSYSPRYMLIELATGICFLFLLINWNQPGVGPSGFSLMTIWYVIFTCLLMIAIFTDFDHWIHISSHSRWGTALALVFALMAGFWDKGSLIALSGPFPYIRLDHPDWVEAVLAVLTGPAQALPEGVIVQWWEPLANAAFGAFFGPGLIFLIGYLWKLVRGQEGMGFGDVELFVMIGATFGAVNSVIVLVVASFVGSFVGISSILISMMKPRQASPLDAGRWVGADSKLGEDPEPGAPKAVGTPKHDPEEHLHAQKFAASLGLEFVELAEVEWNAELIAEYPAALAIEELALPLSRDGKGFTLAVSNPLSSELIAHAKKALGNLELRFKIAPESELIRLAEEHFGARYNEEQKNAAETNSAEEAAAIQRVRRWQDFARISSTLPREKPAASLPFIPWIAVGCFLLLFAYPQVLEFLNFLFLSPLNVDPLVLPNVTLQQKGF